MAGVDHAYQYSVEVKSRFSLFLDDNLNNEDPDLLISKLQQSKVKRDKVAKGEPKVEAPTELKQVQDVKVAANKQTKTTLPVAPAAENRQAEPDVNHQAVTRRGDFNHRGFRGRGRGNYPVGNNVADPAGDTQHQGGQQVEFRGRGRGRGRPFRGRGFAYTDYRESSGQFKSQRSGLPSNEQSPDGHAENGAEVLEANENVEPTDGADDSHENAEVPEEPKMYTLEEYKAMRSSTKPVITLATKGTRKANDGKDVFKNMVEHRKIVEVSEEKDLNEHQNKEIPVEDKFEINVTFTDRLNESGRPPRGFGGRGFGRGRGAPGPRGARGRGGPNASSGFRGDRGRGIARGSHFENPAAPVFNSDQDFPSLK